MSRCFGFLLSVSLVVWVFASCDPADSGTVQPAGLDRDGERINNQGIIGGEKTTNADWPGVVMLSSGGSICTGTLIHPQVVLSAGHCVKLDQGGGMSFDATVNPGSLSVRYGVRAAKNLGRAEEIVTHPTWHGDLSAESADLSLIKLRTPATIEHYGVRDFPLPSDGDEGMLVGYGAMNNTWNSGAGTQRAGETTLLHVFSDVIETGDPANTCSGDSGGPLFTEVGGEWVVTGVTSFGTSSNCYADRGSFSVNLVAYCSWLNETMIDLVGEGLDLDKCVGCDATVAADWGGPCGTGYPDCPAGATCRFPEGFSSGTVGYCAADCCRLNEVDSAYCGDVAGGSERCLFIDGEGDRYCAIECEEDTECPEGTSCKNKPFESQKICIATTELCEPEIVTD